MKINKLILTAALLGLSFSAVASDNCSIKLKGDDRMQFDSKEVKVSASCPKITIELEHTGKLPVAAMGHNIVVAKTSDVAGIAKDAISAGAANGYLPKDDPRVIGATKMIGGGEKAQSSIGAKKLVSGGDYTFFCSFPGHSSIMKGKIVVVP